MDIKSKLKRIKEIKETTNTISKSIEGSLLSKQDFLMVERDIEKILTEYYDDCEYESIPLSFDKKYYPIVKQILKDNNIKFLSMGDSRIIIKGE